MTAPIAQPITNLFARERPFEKAVILGKGPSLDRYTNAKGAGSYVVGINDVACVFRCHAVVFSDAPFDECVFDEGIDIIRHARWRISHEGRGYVYSLPRNPDGPFMFKEPKYAIPRIGDGSLTHAITVLGIWGFREMRLWGCDSLLSDDGNALTHAERAKELTAIPATPEIYKSRRAGALAALAHYKIAWSMEVV